MKEDQDRTERVRRALEILSRPMGMPMDKSKAREEIDKFFTGAMLPRLAQLNKAGRLPDLATDPTWSEAERLWNTLADDCASPASIEQIKAAMLAAAKSYEEMA